MEAGQRRRQDQHRAVAEQHPETLCLIVTGLLCFKAARCAMVDGALGDRQNRGDGQHTEDGGKIEDRHHAKAPAQIARQACPHHIAGMIPGLIASVLRVEAALPHDAQRHTRHRRADGGPGDCRGDLADGHDRRRLRQQDEKGGQHGADAGDDHHQPLFLGMVDEGAGWHRHDHAGHAPGGHHRADGAGGPSALLQKNAQKRADPRLHVGHEEIEGLQRGLRLALR
jgi:hypothetical protein